MRLAAALCAAFLALCGAPALAQQPDYTKANADRQAMLDRLGIPASSMRPGADGFNRQAPNAANYDEANAGEPALMGVLTMVNGDRVDSPRMWWGQRRPEIVGLFDREVYGRVPKTAPVIRWKLVKEERATEAGVPVVKRWYEGTADNRAHPGASAVIQLRYTVPEKASRVPLILSFGFPEGFRFPGPPRPPEPGPSAPEQLIANGFGYGVIVANSIQADNGGGLDDGVIGISLRGKPRGPEDWGVLRAWAWGASRAFDQLVLDSRIDRARIGIEGLSRYGKAALVTLAYDQRFAIGFVGSSGAGGAALYRRNFGERMGNLCAGGEYHWFAGNFLKYCAKLTEVDLPIDSHLLISLVAPRPVFIGAGTVETGDGWVDPKGSFLAAQAAAPAWELLGKAALSTSQFPPVLVPAIEGMIGFRQHQGGHNNRDNWPTFIRFARVKLNR